MVLIVFAQLCAASPPSLVYPVTCVPLSFLPNLSLRPPLSYTSLSSIDNPYLRKIMFETFGGF